MAKTRKPETKLMTDIFDVWYEDDDLESSIKGRSLKTTLTDVIGSLYVSKIARRHPSFQARFFEIIRLRYGLWSDGSLSLADVGLRLGVTRERVRQIEIKALRMLRHPGRRKRLKPYIKVTG